MTTLILDRKNQTLYADKLEVWGDDIKIFTNKIELVTNKKNKRFIILGSGSSVDIIKFKHFFSKLNGIEGLLEKAMSSKKPTIKSLELIIVDAEMKTWFVNRSLIPIEITDDLFTAGAGGQMAMILWDSGADICDIFRLISERTTHTSKEFDSYYYGS